MDIPSLTRFLYLKNEVKHSLLFCILKRTSLKECLFWCSELYYSGYYKELWKFLHKIYYDFYAINNPKLEKFICKMKEKWEIKHKIVYLLHIIKNFYMLENNNPLVFLIRMSLQTQKSPGKSYRGRPPNWLNELNTKKKYKNLLLSIHNKHYKNIAYYLRRFRDNEDELYQVIVNYYNKTLNSVKIYNGEDKIQSLIATMVYLSLEDNNKREIHLQVTKEELTYAMNTNILATKLYKVLKEKRLFKICANIGCFSLHNKEYPDSRTILLNHWEYFSFQTPLWRERLNKYKIKIDSKKFLIEFEDEMTNCKEYEDFYENYNYEPDEQSKEVQERSTSAIADISINNWLNIIFGEYKIMELDSKYKYLY
jgi:hypothetical protein